ncbi:MAG: sensor histidine kinase, partial [Bacteroidia bacterium]
ELKNTQLEAKSLRGQMNPHFIFNVLNSIQKSILKEDKVAANELLGKFSKLIRSSLKYSRLEFIQIEEEVVFLKNYISVENQRFPNRFTFKIEIDPELKEIGVKIPPLIIQPLCENAIKHAFTERGGELLVSIHLMDNDSLKVVVQDNGVGIDNSQKIRDDESLGMKIVKSRLELFKDQGYEASMEVSFLDNKTKTGTVVELTLPYK